MFYKFRYKKKPFSPQVTFPDMWTNSWCSHPLATPTELEETAARGVRLAAQRRAAIELGLRPTDCRPDQIRYLTRILYAATSASQEWGEHELDYILFFRGQVDLRPNPEEVAAVEWVDRAQLPEFVAEVRAGGGQLTPWFHLISQVGVRDCSENAFLLLKPLVPFDLMDDTGIFILTGTVERKNQEIPVARAVHTYPEVHGIQIPSKPPFWRFELGLQLFSEKLKKNSFRIYYI